MKKMPNSKKHAYMLMVHNEWRILKLIMTILDDERNDFYIHIDLKVKDGDIPYDIRDIVKKSRVILVPRMSVTWGGDGQVECELKLFQKAAQGKYRYYHFISGVDMPLMNVDNIYKFFEEHDGENYFQIRDSKIQDSERIKYYFLWQNRLGKGTDKDTLIYQKLQGWSLKLQRLFKVNRLRNSNLKLYKGEIWFSITDELMQYIVDQEEIIKRVFMKGWCADEICWGTIAKNSPYADKIVNGYIRYIDWEHGDPYIFREKDYERIVNSGSLFARKFSDAVDNKIVDMIFEEVTKMPVKTDL